MLKIFLHFVAKRTKINYYFLLLTLLNAQNVTDIMIEYYSHVFKKRSVGPASLFVCPVYIGPLSDSSQGFDYIAIFLLFLISWDNFLKSKMCNDGELLFPSE